MWSQATTARRPTLMTQAQRWRNNGDVSDYVTCDKGAGLLDECVCGMVQYGMLMLIVVQGKAFGRQEAHFQQPRPFMKQEVKVLVLCCDPLLTTFIINIHNIDSLRITSYRTTFTSISNLGSEVHNRQEETSFAITSQRGLQHIRRVLSAAEFPKPRRYNHFTRN